VTVMHKNTIVRVEFSKTLDIKSDVHIILSASTFYKRTMRVWWSIIDQYA